MKSKRIVWIVQYRDKRKVSVPLEIPYAAYSQREARANLRGLADWLGIKTTELEVVAYGPIRVRQKGPVDR